MSYLLDTNVLSELRKGSRCHPTVAAWYSGLPPEDLYLSALTLGELRKGVELVRRRDPVTAERLDAWMQEVTVAHGERILGVDAEIAERWGRLNVPDPLPVVDGLLAATALTYRLTLVTRNVGDIARTGVAWLDPFSLEEGGGSRAEAPTS
ncbi:MAG TPA: type II toxin-antitoxin system VapC family toxin [Thermoanaerobaculia bacterium]|nr:type II toxin-antitoxin system VapC family toxin [Thermoanaerobaculia bacterium]